MLCAHGLFAKPEKCIFHMPTVEYLGFHVSPEGVTMDATKVNTILTWPSPQSCRDVQSFLGFANFYRWFICDFSHLAEPLTALTKADAPFLWSPEAAIAFQKLKACFTTAPILCHADPTQPFILETDASGVALGAILSQRYTTDSNHLHPLAFYS